MPNKRMNSIKDKDKYEALRDEGMSKQKAARIANSPNASKHGGEAKNMEERSKQELMEQAKKIGLKGRSSMTKTQLVEALRHG